MTIKWKCLKCGKNIGDGIPEGLFNEEDENPPIPIDWNGICPYCEGKLEEI